MTVSLFLFTK